MEGPWIVIVALVVAAGLWVAARARRVSPESVLEALGFRASDGVYRGAWRGRDVTLTPDGEALTATVALDPSPLAHETLVRALGRGELMGALHEHAASAGERALNARLAAGWRVATLRAWLDRLAALADRLEALPRAEGMVRWFLETSDGGARVDALARLLAAYPDAPETLDACKQERDHPYDARTADLAREHLRRRGDR